MSRNSPTILTILAACVFLAHAVPTPADAANRRGRVDVLSPEVEDLIRRARAGDIMSQRLLGDRYERGNGISRNFHLAAKWYRKAAAKGDAISQRNLGYFHESGFLGDKDYAKAEKWYRKAAEQGDTEAQRSLAFIYESGLTGQIDAAEAAKWRERADGRTAGNPEKEIASIRPAAPDAAEKASHRAAGRIGYGSSVGLSSSLGTVGSTATGASPAATTESSLKAPRKPRDIGMAMNVYALEAEDGDMYAQYRLALVYLNGVGVKRDAVRAYDLLSTAAQGGYARAQAAMGALYARGLGVPKDNVRAYAWFSLAEQRLTEGRFLDHVVAYRKTAENEMTPREKAAAKRLTTDWEKGIVPATMR